MKKIIVSNNDLALLDYAIQNWGVAENEKFRNWVLEICKQNPEKCIQTIERYCWDKESLATLSNYSEDAIVQFFLRQTFLWIDFIKSYLKFDSAYQKEVSFPDEIVEVLDSCKNDSELQQEFWTHSNEIREAYDRGDYSLVAAKSAELIQAIRQIPKTKANILTSVNEEVLMFAIRRESLSKNNNFCTFIKNVCRTNPTLCISVLQKNGYGHYLGTLPDLDEALINFVFNKLGLWREMTSAYIESLKPEEHLPEEFVNIILTLLNDKGVMTRYSLSKTEAFRGVLPEVINLGLPKGIELEIKQGEPVGYIPPRSENSIILPCQPKVILRTPDNRCCFVAEPGCDAQNTSAFVTEKSQEYPITFLALANSNNAHSCFSGNAIRTVREIFEAFTTSNKVEELDEFLESRNERYRELAAGKLEDKDYTEFGASFKEIIESWDEELNSSIITTAKEGSLTVVVVMGEKVLCMNWGDNQIYSYADNKLEPVSVSEPCEVISLAEIGQLIVTTRGFTEQMKKIMYDRLGDKSIITEMPVVASELADSAVGAVYGKSPLTRCLARTTKNPSYGIMTVRGNAK